MPKRKNSIDSPGSGVIVGLLILLSVELYLHNDDFLHRYRSVFAVGRAADKIDYVASVKPTVVFLGNSRVDNGIDPKVVASTLNFRSDKVFNLGIPGANARVLYGVVRKLEQRNALSGMRCVLIGMDEMLFTSEDSMNYSVFIADRLKMFEYGEYRSLLASIFRLWGFSPNLKGLREPAKLRDFLFATLTDREPWGGSARDSLGFRAKKERLDSREVPLGSGFDYEAPHLPETPVKYILDLVDLLQSKNIHIGVFFPPQYSKANIFEHRGGLYSGAGNLIAALKSRNISLYSIPDSEKYPAELFANPGHLNEWGAIRYSKAISSLLRTNCISESTIDIQ